MARPSYRQLLVAAFLGVALLLGGVALRGQLALEALLERSHDDHQRALTLAGHAERIDELALAMERAARQYLVLGDGALRSAYQRAADEAEAHLRALAGPPAAAAAEPGDGLAEAARSWRAQRRAVERLLAGPPDPARDAPMAAAFRDMSRALAQLTEQLRSATARRNQTLQAEIADARLALGRQWAGAVLLVLVLALALAFALARPLARVEAAIVALGENRLDERIDIPGPSDVRALGRRLDWLRQRLNGQDADKARFLRHVSHELKTPLAALREGVALLQDGVAGPLSPSQREVSRILGDNTAALQQRIEDLLSFNATAFAAERLVRKPVELGALLAGVVRAQQLLWQARRLTVQVVGGPLRADVDAALIEAAVANLLANAIRYSPEGGTVVLGLQPLGDGVALTVSDQGPGVAAAERERIFEPFFRGSVPPPLPLGGTLPGTGIGLSIVAEAVSAHGGRVELLQDPPGTGCRFRIELPHALSD